MATQEQPASRRTVSIVRSFSSRLRFFAENLASVEDGSGESVIVPKLKISQNRFVSDLDDVCIPGSKPSEDG